MKVTMLLADAVEQSDPAKISALGLGWSITSSPTPPMALVIFLDVDPGEFGSHRLHVWLSKRGEDEPVKIVQGDEAASVELGLIVNIAGPVLTDELPARISVPIPIAPFLPLAHDAIYSWHLEIDGEGHPDWSVPLYVRPAEVPSEIKDEPEAATADGAD